MKRLTQNIRSESAIPLSLRTRVIRLSARERRTAIDLIRQALGRFARRIRSAEVWLEDVNGPRGGVDLSCRIQLQLRPHGQIAASALSTMALDAVAKAARRARARLRRRTSKTRALRRVLVRD